MVLKGKARLDKIPRSGVNIAGAFFAILSQCVLCVWKILHLGESKKMFALTDVWFEAPGVDVDTTWRYAVRFQNLLFKMYKYLSIANESWAN